MLGGALQPFPTLEGQNSQTKECLTPFGQQTLFFPIYEGQERVKALVPPLKSS